MRTRKPRVDKNKPVPPLRALKNLCVAKPEVGESVYAWTEESTQADVRAAIAEKFGIALGTDASLSQWRSWWCNRQLLEKGTNQTVEVLEWYRTNRPDATPEELRSAQFMALSLRTEAEGDREMQLKVLKEQGRDLDRNLASRRVVLLETKLDRATKLVKSAQEKGGMTPETLAQLERELKLV